jgi:hypothetical protein
LIDKELGYIFLATVIKCDVSVVYKITSENFFTPGIFKLCFLSRCGLNRIQITLFIFLKYVEKIQCLWLDHFLNYLNTLSLIMHGLLVWLLQQCWSDFNWVIQNNQLSWITDMQTGLALYWLPRLPVIYFGTQKGKG